MMKKILLTIVAFLSVPLLWAQTNFRSLSFEEALVAAKQEKKMVFIDFYTDWCGPCKMMARQTFPLKEVGDYMNNTFVCLKLNAEKEGKELAARFEVKAYPTFTILDADGKKVNEVRGFMDGKAFLEKMKYTMNPDMSPERMAQRYAAGERTPELVNNYALHKMEQEKEKEGFEIVDSYFQSLTDAQRLLKENAFLFTRYTFQLNDAKGRFMVNHRNEFDASVQEAINEKIGRLYRTELITYFSGYRRQSNQYKEEEYQTLKKEIIDLGLDKTYQLQPMFTLIEARQTCDDAAYVDLCAKEYSNLADNDRGLLIINLPRLIDTEDVAVLKKMSQLIRSKLSEMSVNNILMAGRVLSSIEGKINQ